MSFSTVPVRSNSDKVVAGWFNTLRTAGINLEAAVIPGAYNFALNSLFRYWQNGLSRDTGFGVTDYACDQWGIINNSSSGTEIRNERIAGVNTKYAHQFSVTVDGGTGGEYQLFYPIGNQETRLMFNKTINFSGKIKAVGNVNSVDVKFYYNTSEALSGRTLLASTNVAVNSSGFIDIDVNQAIGTQPTDAGIIIVIIEPSTVSAGDLNDVGNGAILELPMIVIASAPPTQFFPSFQDPALELKALQYYYEKSYAVDTITGASVSLKSGEYRPTNDNGAGGNVTGNIVFKVRKRAVPTVSFWSPNGTLNNYEDEGGADNVPASGAVISEVSEVGYVYDFNTQTGDQRAGWHWNSDARIF